MMREGGAPGVQHCSDADAGTQMPGISCERERRLGRGLHEQIVDCSFVLVGDIAIKRSPRAIATRKSVLFSVASMIFVGVHSPKRR
jgi:hypothetical protein